MKNKYDIVNGTVFIHINCKYLEASTRAPKRSSVSSMWDLRNHIWIRRWSKMANFHRYSQFCCNGGSPKLVAEFDNGKTWYVIGFMSELIDELPDWNPTL